MKHAIFLFAFALAASGIFVGCKENSTSSGSGIPGKMVGYVYFTDSTYESWVYRVEKPLEGATVSLDGTTFRAVTDSSGKWIISNVPPGIYSISYTKKGYSQAKDISHQFVGNGTDYVGIATLDQVPILHTILILRPFEDYRKADSSIEPLGEAAFSADVREWANPNYEGMLIWCIFFSNTDQIDPNKPNSFVFQSQFRSAASRMPVYKDTLHALGFKTNDKIYCLACASTDQCQYDKYLDLNSGKYVYTGFGDNHSEVKSFILP